MSETNLGDFETKTDGDRTVMHVLYGMHTLAWFSAGTFALVALIVNYIRRADEHDGLYIDHHNYMISTFWWTMLLLVITSPLYLLFFFPGVVAWFLVWLWYLYRCIRGWMRFTSNRPATDFKV